MAPEFYSPTVNKCSSPKETANANVVSNGQRHFELIYPSGFQLYPIPATLSHGAILADTGIVFGTGVRGFVKNPPGENSRTWVLPAPAARVNAVFNNIGLKGDWIGASYNQLTKLEIHLTPNGGANDLANTIAELQARFPDGKYPAIVIFNEPDTGPGDTYEIRQWWYFGHGTRFSGESALKYNNSVPYFPTFPYSNSVRGGDLVFTSQFGGINPITRQLIADPLEQVRQAFANMLAAGKALGAKKKDLYRVEVHTTSLATFESLVDIVTKELFEEGRYPTRVIDQVNQIYFVEAPFVVAGQFYAPKKQC